MSHIVKIDMKFKSKPALIAAALAVGLEFKEGQKTCRGEYGDQMTGNAHSIVDKNGSMDIGVIETKNAEGETEFELRSYATWRFGNAMKRAYTEAVTCDMLTAQGMRFTKSTAADGSMLITASA